MSQNCIRLLQIREMNVPSYASSSWLQGPLRDCAQSSNDDGALARKLLDAGVDTEEMDRVRLNETFAMMHVRSMGTPKDK